MTTQDLERNPFSAVAKATRKTLTPRAAEEDMVKLALIFRCAHQSSDVWAGCRVERALGGYSEAGLSCYLSGPQFAPYVDDEEAFPDLEVIKMHAEDFLEQRPEL